MLPKLYEFQSEFIQLMDEIEKSIDENGEIPKELSDKLDEFNSNKLLKVTNCVQYYFQLNHSLDAVKSEINRLTAIKKKVEKGVDWIKNYLKTNLNNEPIKQDTFSITYRNSETVEVEETLDLEELHKKFPDLIDKDIVYSVNKIKIKEYKKKGLPIPEGISIKQNTNIQIK